MLTDIFARRYEGITLRDGFEERDQRLIVQLFRILVEDVCPYWVDGKASDEGKKFWTELNSRLSRELGLTSLSKERFSYMAGPKNAQYPATHRYPPVDICKNWMLSALPQGGSSDAFIKERLSLVELGFRQRAEALARQAQVVAHYSPSSPSRPRLEGMNRAFAASVKELNEHLPRAGYPLHYHNGFLQFSQDKAIETHVEAPFWALVAGPKWGNVDHDMKEAIDLRDAGRRDAAWYAARALESTIKIISDAKGWTHGGEKGASGFIDNLQAKKNGGFIDAWEGDALRAFFKEVRNPFGHGPGSAPMPSLVRTAVRKSATVAAG